MFQESFNVARECVLNFFSLKHLLVKYCRIFNDSSLELNSDPVPVGHADAGHLSLLVQPGPLKCIWLAIHCHYLLVKPLGFILSIFLLMGFVQDLILC